jgi:hypothetical protein
MSLHCSCWDISDRARHSSSKLTTNGEFHILLAVHRVAIQGSGRLDCALEFHGYQLGCQAEQHVGDLERRSRAWHVLLLGQVVEHPRDCSKFHIAIGKSRMTQSMECRDLTWLSSRTTWIGVFGMNDLPVRGDELLGAD